MFSLRLSSFWNLEILSWGVYRWCLFTDKGFLDFSAADCDFKKFFFVFSDCPYLLLTTSLIFCVCFRFHVFFHVLVSVVSASLFKPRSVSAFFEFLFFRYSLSAPIYSSYLDLTVFRDLCCLSLVLLSCDLCCIFHALLCPCLLKGGKKALLSSECLLVSLYYNGLVLGSQAFTNFRLHMNNILWLKDESLDKFSFTNCD